jgi:Permuted papain-like amidase enzyme, YaeF/YiiX, C92 family
MIREGRCIVEALRPGVMLNTLEHFLNVDDLLLVRPHMNEDPARVADTREAIITAMTHLGKSYDFGFDIHSRRRIVCSELSFQSYTQPEFHWPKERVLGRYTISPDHVALRALPVAEHPPSMRVLLFYSRGERVPGDQAHLEKEIAARINVKLKSQ